MTPLIAAAIALALVPPPAAPAPAVELPPIAAVVARCESGGNPTAKNPISSASGLYQFVDGTWSWVTGLEPPASAWPVEVQHQAFVDLWDDGAGRAHWRESWRCMDLHAPGWRNQHG